MKNKRKLWFSIGGFILILLILWLISFFTNMGKVDDWQLTSSNVELKSFITGKLLFTRMWWLYLITVAVLAYIIIPIYHFTLGIILKIQGRKEEPSTQTLTEENVTKKMKGAHKIWLGLPMILFLVCAPIGFLIIWLTRKSYVNNLIEIITLIVSAIVLISIIVLLAKGLYEWIKYRKTKIKRKLGRNKFLFSLYYFAFLVIIPYSIFTFVNGNLMTATSSGYGSAGSYGVGTSLGTTAGLGSSGGSMFKNSFVLEESLMAPVSDSIGFSVGGAKDINNFRENIKNDYLPIPTDVTYEGVYYDYYFDTGMMDECSKLFCPSYTSAISKDPFSGEDEYLLSVGLNSGMKESDFARKKLNLTIVLDISGSMGSPFNQYYYDQFGNSQNIPDQKEEDSGKAKMEVAAESAVALINHLTPDDRFGMVLFDDIAYVAKPLRKVKDTDMDAIKNHILEIREQGGTNMSAGMEAGTKLYDEYVNANSDEYENRIIFLTDAQPNLGTTNREGIADIAQKNSDNKIFTTFIGIGVDFNTDLVESITKIKGANYYSVHSPSEFKQRMDANFDYMVTPLVFDLKLTVDAPGFEIQEVYGSPEADEATGEIMKVNTLFPSERINGETKGGLVLLHMKKISDNPAIKLTASYKDRSGREDSSIQEIKFTDKKEYYDNSGIRKGIVLARYINLLKKWMIDERNLQTEQFAPTAQPEPVPLIDENNPEMPIVEPTNPILKRYDDYGIPVFGKIKLGEWERQSMKLKVSSDYKEVFNKFSEYFSKEMKTIGDETMQQELDILNKLKTTN